MEFKIPNVGDNVTSVTVVDWLIEDGMQVDEGQDVLEVETDKATVPIPATASGILRHGPHKAGDEISVEVVLGNIETTETVTAPAPAEPSAPASEATAATSTASNDETTRATPMARKLAADLGVPLADVAGSGSRGRVTKADVLGQQSASVVQPAQPVSQPIAQAVITTPTPIIEASSSAPTEPQTQAALTTASLSREVDLTELVALQEQLNQKMAEKWGFAITETDFLIAVTSNTLRQFPDLVASASTLHIGVQEGQNALVLEDAGRKNLKAVAETLHQLRQKEGDQIVASTIFSVINAASLDVDLVTPTLSGSETASLGLGRTVAKPVVHNGEIAIRQMAFLTIAFNSRKTDAGTAASFLKQVCDLLEQPELLFFAKR